jgi:hypothetical protein
MRGRAKYLAEYRRARKVRKAGLIFVEFEITEVAKGHPVKPFEINHNLKTLLWCGPAVVSALTGADTDTIRELIRVKRKDSDARVIGTHPEEIEYAFYKLGYSMRLFYMCHSHDNMDHLTLAKWLRTYKRKPGVGYVIELCGTKKEPSGHWCVVLGNHYCCSLTGKWVPLDKCPNRRVRVESVHTVRRRRRL